MVSGIYPFIETVRSVFAFLDSPRGPVAANARAVHVVQGPAHLGEEAEVHYSAVSHLLNEIEKVCAQASKFFCEIYADIRLFIRAWSQLPSLSQEGALNASRSEIERFRDRCRAAGRERIDCVQEFRNLSGVTRDLFYQIDEDFLIIYRHENDPELRREMKKDIIRECDRILQFQRVVHFVSLLFRGAGGESNGEIGPVSSAVPNESPVRIDGVRINIPGTVAYTRNEIPSVVKEKADEIESLVDLYDNLPNPPKAPEDYICSVLQDFMRIPVFDASHPQVQADFATPSVGAAATTAPQINHTVRHNIDSTALMRLSTPNPGKCPSCRHPAIGGMRWDYMRIDTALQDQILEFLRNAVANG